MENHAEILDLIRETLREGSTSLSLYNYSLTELPPEIGEFDSIGIPRFELQPTDQPAARNWATETVAHFGHGF